MLLEILLIFVCGFATGIILVVTKGLIKTKINRKQIFSKKNFKNIR